MRKEEFSLKNLGELSKEKIAKRKEKEAHAEWVEGFKERKEAEEEERTEDLKILAERDKKAAAKSRAGRQELEFEKTISEKVKEAEEEERQRDIKKMRKKITKKSEEEPSETYEVLPAEKAEDKKEVSAETQEALKELRAVEKKKIKEQEEKLRQELAEEKPEEELYEVLPAKKSGKEKKDEAIIEYLRHAISDHPELMTPEIKKNIDIIKKQEALIIKNEGNAKKNAREKVKNAKEVIQRAQSAVEDYFKDIVKDYNESSVNIKDVEKTMEDAEKKLFSEKYNQYDVAQNSIARFFKERKLKKQLKPKDFDKFEEFKLAYYDAFGRYDRMLKTHTKKYSRLESVLEAGTSFQMAQRGGGEKLPGVRGR